MNFSTAFVIGSVLLFPGQAAFGGYGRKGQEREGLTRGVKVTGFPRPRQNKPQVQVSRWEHLDVVEQPCRGKLLNRRNFHLED